MQKELLISIIIPVKNGDQWLDNLFQKLLQQTVIDQTEIIVIDSGSTDTSLEIINRYPVQLIQIPAAAFNHGETRNLGVRQAKGKYVVMTVQDAVPVSDLWLQHFLDGFINETVAGVCGQQVVPHDLDKNPALWFRPVSAPQKRFQQFINKESFFELTPDEQRNIAGWDNVTAAYKRDVLLDYPFPKIDFAEDMFWAKEIILKGYTLAYVDEARVYHYHHHLPDFVLPRYFSIYYYEYKIFKLRPKFKQSPVKRILVIAKLLFKESSVSLAQKFYWLKFNIQYLLAIRKTIHIFNKALDNGDGFLDKAYQKICNKIPQAPKY